MHNVKMKTDDRFAPVFVKQSAKDAIKANFGHPSMVCRGGVHNDKRLSRLGTRSSQVKSHLKDWL